MATKKEKKDILINSILNELKELELLTKGMQDPKVLHDLAQKKAKNLLTQYKELQEIANSVDESENIETAPEVEKAAVVEAPKVEEKKPKQEVNIQPAINVQTVNKPTVEAVKPVAAPQPAVAKTEVKPAPQPVLQQPAAPVAVNTPKSAAVNVAPIEVKPIEPVTTSTVKPFAVNAEPVKPIEPAPAIKPVEPAAPQVKPEEQETVQTKNDLFRNNTPSSATSSNKMTAVQSIKKSIGLSDRFMYLKELFKGDSNLMNKTIDDLDNMEDINAALAYVQSHFEWDMKDEKVESFINLLHRRY